jgi:TP901 family phage tail tape measure protein
MSLVGDVSVRLGINVKDFQKGLEQAQAKLQNVSERFRTAGESMAKALTVPLLAVGGVALKGAIDVQKSQGLIQAQLGLTADEAKELQGVVTNLYNKGFGEGMDEVTNSVTNVVRNMKSLKGASTDTIQTITADVMNMANVFNQDVNDITKSANNMMEAFGNIDVTETFDLITAGFQNGLDYAGDFLDTINEYSVHFSTMGFSAKEMFDVFNAGAESGTFNLDKVGDLVKELNIRLKDGSKTTAEAMGSLSSETQKLWKHFLKTGEGGKDVFQAIMKDLSKIEDSSVRNQIGVALMGTMFEDLEYDAVKALAEMDKGLQNVEGSTKRMSESMNKDLGTVLTSAFRQVQTSLAPLGNEIAKLVEKYLPPVIKKIQEFSNWFTGLSDKAQLAVVALGGFALIFPFITMGIGMFALGLKSVIGGIGGIINVVSKASKAFGLLKNALNFTKILPLITSPVGLIIGAILGLITIGVLVWKNWDTIKAKAVEIWGAILDFLSSTWETIKTKVSEVFGSIVDWISEKWNAVKTKTSETWNSVVNTVTSWASRLYKESGLQDFVNYVKEWWNVLKTTTKIVFEMIVAIIGAIWKKIVQVVSPVIKAVWNAIKSAWNNIKNITSTVFNTVKSVLTNVWRSIVNFVKPIVTNIWNTIKGAWNKVKSTTSTIFNNVKNIVSNVWNTVKSKITSVASSIWSTVKSKFNALKSAMTSPIESAKNTIRNVLNNIKSFFSNLKLKFPKPKLPHISVSKGYKEFLGQKIPYPKFSVSWHAKGAIFNQPTLFASGHGVGEAGAEVVMPIEHKRYMKPYAETVASILKDMEDDEPKGNIINQFNISQLVVREEADIQRIAYELERIQRKQQRAKGAFVY